MSATAFISFPSQERILGYLRTHPYTKERCEWIKESIYEAIATEFSDKMLRKNEVERLVTTCVENHKMDLRGLSSAESVSAAWLFRTVLLDCAQEKPFPEGISLPRDNATQLFFRIMREHC